MIFSWNYQGQQRRHLRSVLRSFGVSNSLIKQAIFHGGAMYIDGHEAWAKDMVLPGQQISLQLPDEPANPKITPYPANFKIAYEDRDFLIINKDAGVATVPAHHVDVQDSLVNQVKDYYQKQGYKNQVTHVATRLDRDTSGLVIFPKHRFAHAVLDRQLKAHQVRKEYMALASGTFDISHVYLDAPIQRDPQSFVKRQVGMGNKPKSAVTEFWLLHQYCDYALVKIRLHTGRTHQIRCHFAYLGHPLLGDEMYGGPMGKIQRQALHCYHISFFSPFLNKQIICNADIPDDMQALISKNDFRLK